MKNAFVAEALQFLDQMVSEARREMNICIELHTLAGHTSKWPGEAHLPERTIHLWEDVWHKSKPLAQARLIAIMGHTKRIHARSTLVRRIDKKINDSFLLTNHLQGTTGAYYKYGLYLKEELVAVATFGKSRIMFDDVVPYRSYECERFATKAGYRVTGGLGKLMSCFIETHHPAHIMTYIDKDWSNGSGFEKTGFKKTGEIPPHTYFIKRDEWTRHPENRLPEKVLTDLKSYNSIRNSGSIKMILDLRK